MTNLDEKLDKVLERYTELRDLLATDTPPDPKVFAKLSKEYSDMTALCEKIQQLKKVQKENEDLAEILKDPETDEEMKALAEEEQAEIQASFPVLEEEIKVLLLPKDEDDERNAILEIRAGTGGEEASLFASDLLRMYQRYAENHKWKFELMNVSETGLGGIKDASVNVTGRDVFARLKFESGVHRVQRVPETETSGRIHTSAATVAVLPEAKEVDIVLEEKNLRIDVFRASGPGGQSVNTTDSAVRITHIPTGIVVQQQDEKSQHKNKAKAMKILRSRIYDAERAKVMAERSAARKSQVGSGDRSERIRTYNFPQGRVTDHRINLTLYKLESIMDGTELDTIIEALISNDQVERLAELS
ncbi:MAG: peptide chain release factor 1 [Alphaproteobacteria bacterium]|jgi:peptide chain release factor 1|nr:peptide chain release factor 1 [Alphaproteobacteria bacterium]MBT5389734.1 peptide chain release factor 1 [Alphaproteobacteria bacterium]MBT5541003.1 peptide chain release factor 1 [Alphaproteobacteria bacterium]MBT5654532.1 peptide chain release factor 1 [Alphaproteobacteria bacterium]